MSLIDWWWVARQIPWILGLATLLLTLSWGNWEAHITRRRRRDVWAQPSYQAAFSLGFALFTLGLALNPQRWWEPYLWGAFFLYFGVQAILLARGGWRSRGEKPRA